MEQKIVFKRNCQGQRVVEDIICEYCYTDKDFPLLLAYVIKGSVYFVSIESIDYTAPRNY